MRADGVAPPVRLLAGLRQQKQRSFSSPLSRPSFSLHLPPPLPPLNFVLRSISLLLLSVAQDDLEDPARSFSSAAAQGGRAKPERERVPLPCAKSQQESIKNADKRRGAEPELMVFPVPLLCTQELTTRAGRMDQSETRRTSWWMAGFSLSFPLSSIPVVCAAL